MNAYINKYHPVYEGVVVGGIRMRVVLNDWYDELLIGNGEIHLNDDQAQYCFKLAQRIVTITNSDAWESTYLKFRISKDFTSLSLVDKISEEKLGVKFKQG